MNTAHGATRFGQTTASTRRLCIAFEIFGVRFKNGANGSDYEPIFATEVIWS